MYIVYTYSLKCRESEYMCSVHKHKCILSLLGLSMVFCGSSQIEIPIVLYAPYSVICLWLYVCGSSAEAGVCLLFL